MGIRFNTNTWRAPLLLIDSWLPVAPTTRPIGARGSLPQAVQRFARAGWLGRVIESANQAASCPSSVNRMPSPSPASHGRACHVRVLRAAADAPVSDRQDTRLVISGRISDVCAELDRLAALEHQRGTAHA